MATYVVLLPIVKATDSGLLGHNHHFA